MELYWKEEAARTMIREAYGAGAPEHSISAGLFYSPEELASIPPGAAVRAFGTGNPVRWANLKPGETVLDVGSGAGIDSLLAAQRVGPAGAVTGVDMTPEMLERARRHAAEAGLTNVQFVDGLMEELPFADHSFDVVISNGVLNLSTRKGRALAEMFRVLKPGGRIALADLTVSEELPEEILKSPAAFVG